FLFLGKQEKEPAVRGRNPAFQTNRAKRTTLNHPHQKTSPHQTEITLLLTPAPLCDKGAML
ncbi:hypothetical protein CAI21_10235, partial [Alkalilimnicola ehrlichii]